MGGWVALLRLRGCGFEKHGTSSSAFLTSLPFALLPVVIAALHMTMSLATAGANKASLGRSEGLSVHSLSTETTSLDMKNIVWWTMCINGSIPHTPFTM